MCTCGWRLAVGGIAAGIVGGVTIITSEEFPKTVHSSCSLRLAASTFHGDNVLGRNCPFQISSSSVEFLVEF